MGSTNGGHYVYYGLRKTNWYLFNDSNVSKIDIETIKNLKNSAYIYLYTPI
jgi:ubiquitin C-terminal hydrolase